MLAKVRPTVHLNETGHVVDYVKQEIELVVVVFAPGAMFVAPRRKRSQNDRNGCQLLLSSRKELIAMPLHNLYDAAQDTLRPTQPWIRLHFRPETFRYVKGQRNGRSQGSSSFKEASVAPRIRRRPLPEFPIRHEFAATTALRVWDSRSYVQVELVGIAQSPAARLLLQYRSIACVGAKSLPDRLLQSRRRDSGRYVGAARNQVHVVFRSIDRPDRCAERGGSLKIYLQGT